MNPICKFSDVLERNMDLLFLEEFVSSPEFLEIFISKINITKAQVLEIEHSKVHYEFGESDMTVIIETNGKRHGLLIDGGTSDDVDVFLGRATGQCLF